MTAEPEFRPLGVDGVLVRFSRVLTEAANIRAVSFRDQFAGANVPGVTEVASSLASVRVGFDPVRTDRKAVTQAIMSFLADHETPVSSPRRLWRIPVCFDGDHAPQLAEAARLAGVTVDQAIAEITAQTTRVIAIGFAPGQPYLGMLPDHWDIPRQSTLTETLPRGALIAAVRQLIIWAADAPTGWRHIGQTAFRVYRPETAEPFAFRPGDAVQFHAISATDYAALSTNTDPDGGAVCEVLR
ncbi:MAG: carboxyltransferase domain-containing protein [Pseudomonadota bacterium]